MLWQTYLQPTTLDEALRLRADLPEARLVAGGTDLLVEYGRGVRRAETVIDLTRVPGIDGIALDGGVIRIGALATHNDVVASALCRERAAPLAEACWEVGAPQLRTRATIAGNLATASPANDTITPLVALGASVVLASARGEREVPLTEFHTGVRRTAMAPDELIREIRVPVMRPGERGRFLKLGLRRAQAISVVNVAAVAMFDGERAAEARIALGSVAPTIVRVPTAEAFLAGKQLDAAACAEAGRLAAAAITPITDVRGSAEYRLATVANLVADALRQIADGVPSPVPDDPVLLGARPAPPAAAPFAGTIETTINGRPASLAASANRTLLDALRDEAGLTGAKEGCGEGECGACTVWLDGQAVMSCLTPAAQAHGAEVVTIEGLAGTSRRPAAGGLHPLQAAFVSCGAVQCGFCIPGMLMAGAKLLDERADPAIDDIRTGLSGNICRCTGYRKIFDAVQAAAGKE